MSGNQLEIQGERRITRIGVGIVDEGFVTKEVVCLSELFLVPDGRKWEDWKAGEAIGFGVFWAGHVEEGWMEVFNEQAPAECTRVFVFGREGKVAVVGVDMISAPRRRERKMRMVSTTERSSFSMVA